MTQNQIAYQALVENNRHNLMMEDQKQQEINNAIFDAKTRRGMAIANGIGSFLTLGAKILSRGAIR